EKLDVVAEDVIHGVTLKAPDLDRRFALFVHHAGALAEDLRGADAAAAMPENIRGENFACGAAQIAGRDFLDEGRHVDVRGTSDRAGRVEAVEAARGFDGGLPPSHRR